MCSASRSFLCGTVLLLKRLARNQTCEGLSDRIKLGSIDKRVGADVQKRDERRNVEETVDVRHVRVCDQNVVDIDRHPADCVERADEDHGLDHVVLDVV